MLPIIAFLTAFGVSLLLVRVCRELARKYGFVAQPRADRWHGRPTALLGGVAIAATVLGLHVVFIGVQALPALLVGATAMFVVGLVDDLVAPKPASKLVFQIAIASFLVFFDFRLGWVSSLTADTILTVFWIVAFTNAFNLLDNMDGLCAGLCLVAGSAVMGAFLITGVGGPEVVHLALLLGAAAGFLVFNFHPASIFMGDSGSLFIGLNLAVLTLTSPTETHAPSSLLSIMAVPALILLVPILDIALVTVSRLTSGRSAAQGGRDHSSHRLVAIGLSERSAVFVLWSLSGLGGLLALALTHFSPGLPSIAAALFVIAAIIFTVYLARVRVYDDDTAGQRPPSGFTLVAVQFVYRRRIAEVLLDLGLTAIAYYSAYRLWPDPQGFSRAFPVFLQSLPLVLGVQLVSLFLVGAYRGVWQDFGLMDGVTFARGVALAMVVNFVLLWSTYGFQSYLPGVLIVDSALLIVLLAGSRASFRLMSELVSRRRESGLRVVIYGVGDVGASAARDVLSRRDGGHCMLGFVVEDPSLERVRIQGYPVLGNFECLLDLVRQRKTDLVVLIHPLRDERLAELTRICQQHRVALERLHLMIEPVQTALVSPRRFA